MTSLHLDLNKTGAKEAFNRLTSDPHEALRVFQTSEALSAMEIALTAAAESDQTLHRLNNLLQSIRDAMRPFLSDAGGRNPGIVKRKDISHHRRLLFYLDKLLFPTDLGWRTSSAHVSGQRANDPSI